MLLCLKPDHNHWFDYFECLIVCWTVLCLACFSSQELVFDYLVLLVKLGTLKLIFEFLVVAAQFSAGILLFLVRYLNNFIFLSFFIISIKCEVLRILLCSYQFEIAILLCNFLNFHLIFHPEHLSVNSSLTVKYAYLYIQ